MGRHNRPNHGGYGRNGLGRRPKAGANSYFVPSFAIRRRAEQGDELEKFLSDVRGEVGKGYTVFDPEHVSITVIEQAKMINQLREARERPDRQAIEELARGIGGGIARLLEGTEPGIQLPIGILSKFGSNGRRNKIGFIPRGWKGYQAKYAREDEAGEKLPVGLLVDENILAVGGIATAFSHNSRFVINGLARTPHATFLRKNKGDITENEFRNISGSIMEVIGDMDSQDLGFEDPVIYPKYAYGESEDPIIIR